MSFLHLLPSRLPVILAGFGRDHPALPTFSPHLLHSNVAMWSFILPSANTGAAVVGATLTFGGVAATFGIMVAAYAVLMVGYWAATKVAQVRARRRRAAAQQQELQGLKAV